MSGTCAVGVTPRLCTRECTSPADCASELRCAAAAGGSWCLPICVPGRSVEACTAPLYYGIGEAARSGCEEPYQAWIQCMEAGAPFCTPSDATEACGALLEAYTMCVG